VRFEESRTDDLSVRVAAVELRRLAMPLVAPFVTRHGAQSTRDLVLVRVLTGDGDGWGECVAMLEPTYSDEYVDAAYRVLRDHLVPRLLVGPDVPMSTTEVAQRLGAIQGNPMAHAAIVDAVLDAALRTRGRALADHLGATRRRVPAGIALGWQPSIDHTLALVDAAVTAGYQRVKIKWSPAAGYETLLAARKAFPDLALQADFNEAWSPKLDRNELSAYDDLGLLLFEQPFGRHDIDAHVRLAALSRTPVCLDESITSVELGVHLVDVAACSVVCVKPGRLGGLLEGRRLHDALERRGIGAWVGGMLETGLGKAGNIALAALDGFAYTGDFSASERLWADDLTEPFVLEGGHLTVPDGPGVGVTPRPEMLARVTTSIELLRR
jgi:O-succinylbenzoate synthase